MVSLSFDQDEISVVTAINHDLLLGIEQIVVNSPVLSKGFLAAERSRGVRMRFAPPYRKGNTVDPFQHPSQALMFSGAWYGYV